MPSRPSTPSLFSNVPAPQPVTSPAPDPSPSTAKWISAHCDGGARGNPGPAGFGALIQDADGTVLAELSEFLGIRTNNFAEYSGLLACLQYALDHHHTRLRVTSDSELMVKQIQGKYKVKSPDLKLLYEEARRRIARLDGFEITHALRHKNKDADRLANEAMDRGMNRETDRETDRGMKRAATPLKATPHPQKAEKPEAPPIPISRPDRPAPASQSADKDSGPAAKPAMLRGFTRNGVVHILGGATLPDGIFVKIIPE